MGESTAGDGRPGALSLPTPSPYMPSPLTPNGTRPRLGPQRQSRFTEDMVDRTPAASVSERSLDYYWYGPSAEDVQTHANANDTTNANGNTAHASDYPAADPATPAHGAGPAVRADRRTWLRSANASLHAVPCLVLLGFMAYAMRVLREDMGSYKSIQAIILMVFLGADVVLDLAVVSRVHKPWPTWALAARFVCGTAYVVLFLVYVGLGDPLPKGHTYWGLSHRSAALTVYVLLCVEGLWNLLHIPVSRYGLARGVLGGPRRPAAPSLAPTLDARTSFNPHQRFSTAGTEHSSISLTWRRWVRTRSSTQYSREDLSHHHHQHDDGFFFPGTATREPSADVTLREQPGEEGEEEHGHSRGRGRGDGAGSLRTTTTSSSSSSSSSHSHSEKAVEGHGGTTEDEKWREAKSEDTVRPVGQKGDER